MDTGFFVYFAKKVRVNASIGIRTQNNKEFALDYAIKHFACI